MSLVLYKRLNNWFYNNILVYYWRTFVHCSRQLVLLRHFMLLFENLCTMNWYGRQAGAGPALSPFEIYIYNLLKDAPQPERPKYNLLKKPRGYIYLWVNLPVNLPVNLFVNLFVNHINCFLNIITINICVVGK